MPRTKKFIDKKNAQTFYLSCAETVSFGDEENGVKCESEQGGDFNSDNADYEAQTKFGIHYDDGYNYMQHLRTVYHGPEAEQAPATRWIPKPSIPFKRDDGEIEGERKRKMEVDQVANNSSRKVEDEPCVVRFRIERSTYDRSFSGVNEFADDVADLNALDDDLRAALEGADDANLDGDELDDDFVTLAGGTIDQSGNKKSKRLRFENASPNSKTTVTNARQERQLDKLLELFDGAASGSDEDDEFEDASGSDVDDVDAMEERFASGLANGNQRKGGSQFDALLADPRFVRELERDVSRLTVTTDSAKRSMRHRIPGDESDDETQNGDCNPSDLEPVMIEPVDAELKEKTKQLAEHAAEVSASDSSTDDEDEQASDVQDEREHWDCESILSLASNTFNLPTVIPRDANATRRNRSGRNDSQSTVTSVSSTTHASLAVRVREKDETAEERKMRKADVKAAQRERRAEKKQTKLEFKREAIHHRERGAAGAETNAMRL